MTHFPDSENMKLKCGPVTNGIFDLEMNDDLLSQCVSCELWYTNNDCEDWKVKPFEAGRLKSGKLHVRVPVLLHSYELRFYLKILYNDKSLLPDCLSPRYSICVPSFLIHTDFHIGQTILYKPDDVWFTYTAVIKEKLPDNYYKIQGTVYSATQGYHFVTNTLHVSQMFNTRKQVQQMVDLTDTIKMRSNLLAKQNDNISLGVFNAIYDGLSDEIQTIAKEIYGGDTEYLSHDVAMTQFVTKHVFDMLFIATFEDRIACFVSGNDGWCQCDNLMMCDAKICNIMLKEGKEIPYQLNRNVLLYSCDWCSVGIRDYDLLFACNAHYVDQHYYCLNCVHTVIELNGELKQLLMDILGGDVLVPDCVQSIVDYVIGKVVRCT
eukprot:930002_1